MAPSGRSCRPPLLCPTIVDLFVLTNPTIDPRKTIVGRVSDFIKRKSLKIYFNYLCRRIGFGISGIEIRGDNYNEEITKSSMVLFVYST